MMGAHKKPTALKAVQGTDKRNKTRMNPNEPVPTNGIGPAPAHLSQSEQAIWDEVVGVMYPGVMGEADRIALEAMVRLIHQMRTNYEEFTAAQMTRLAGFLGQFGMTPADRTKISVPKQKPKNAFEDM